MSPDTLPPPDPDYDPRTEEPGFGFREVLPFTIEEWSDGRAVVVLPLTDQHLNRSRIVHGGVLASMLDFAMGFCGLYCPYRGRWRKSVTINLSTTYLATATGPSLRAVGTRIGGGRKIYMTRGEVYDAAGTLCAMGEGSFKLRAGSETLHGEPRPE